MAEIRHRTIRTNGINMHIAEAGEGPLVIMCHGWPESWYSWRHQLTALADAGFHAVAPDQRGYGQTDAPYPVDQYTQLHMTGDIIGLMDALGQETAVIAGHDWGAPVAWNTAMLRPDRIRAAIGMSVPFSPRGSTAERQGDGRATAALDMGGTTRPTDAMKAIFGDRFFYILYFQTEHIAEHEFARDPERFMRLVLFGASGDAPVRAADLVSGSGLPPNTAFFLDQMQEPEALPAWLTQADIEFFAGEFRRAGFRGGINWYRNIDRNWELFAPFAGLKIHQPSLFIAGDRDVVVAMNPASFQTLKDALPGLRKQVWLPGCGHWTQQERPAEVNAEMIEFLNGLES